MSLLFEIVELPDGEIVLQRVDNQGEPLLNIKFSEASGSFLADAKFEVAKAMIHAGLQAFADLAQNTDDIEGVDDAHFTLENDDRFDEEDAIEASPETRDESATLH